MRDGIQWSTAAVLMTTIAAIAAVLIAHPDRSAEIIAVLGAAGTLATAIMPALRRQRASAERRERATITPPADRAGHASIPALLVAAIVVLGAVAIVATCAAGCSPSAIRVHATTATIATTALAGARPVLLEAVDTAIARCDAAPLEERASCLDEAERTHRRAGVVFDSAVLATGAYRDGIETAALAGDDPAVDAALDRGLAAVRDRWGEFLELVRVLDPAAAARLGGVP
jgi:hypothetical protein